MKHIIKTSCAILLLSFCITFTSCKGQNKAKTLEETIAIGKTVSNLDKTIWTIYQDKKSNYWFGSRANGVYFYNGQQLKQFTTEDGLVSNETRGIQEDALGNIYIETEYGVSKFDGQSFKTVEILNPDVPSEQWTLKPDDLWFRIGFTNNGVYRYDGNYLHYLKFPKSPQEDAFNRKNTNSSLKPYGLYTFYKDRKGVMWFGTASLGVCRYDGKTLSWHYEEHLQTTPEGGDFGTRAIFEDKDGRFWINNTRYRYAIMDNHTSTIDLQKETGIGYTYEKNKIKFPFFQSITQDNDGNLWMVSYNEGVWEYNGKELSHYPFIEDGKQVLLFTIYKDQQGVLWLGSFDNGVYKFNGKSFEKFVK